MLRRAKQRKQNETFNGKASSVQSAVWTFLTVQAYNYHATLVSKFHKTLTLSKYNLAMLLKT